MSRAQSFFAYLALLVGTITFASSFARPTVGQGPVVTGGEGRYQIATAGGHATEVFIIDTVTGHLWYRPAMSAPWVDLGTPPGAK